MMRWTVLFVVSCLLLALTGCGSLTGSPPAPAPAGVSSEVASLTGLHDGNAISSCLSKSIGEQDVCRNSIIQARLITIDAQYTLFRQQFFREARLGGFGAAVLSMGLSGAAAVSGVPAATARILSAISAGVTGTREAFDKEILIQQTATAVERAMDTARANVQLRIQAGMSKNATDYPVAVALSDLEAYYTAGTVLGGLVGVTQAVADKAEATSVRVDEVRGINRTAAARFLQGLAAKTGAEGAKNRQNIRAAIKSLGYGTVVDVVTWVFHPETPATQLVEVAKKMGWTEQ